ncbi:unnamed protein product, partial [marine sediment metagenome]
GNISAIAEGDVYSIGGFAGETTGDLDSQCFATGNVHAVAGITGGWNMIWGIGGFAGYIDTQLTKDCYARGNVHAEHPTDGSGIGGFVGSHNHIAAFDEIDNCYSTGAVTTVGVFTLVGGFCGEINGAGVITPECFWDTETSGMLVSAGGTGKTTAQMKTASTFIAVGWSFGTVWGMTGACNDGYACLLNVTPGCTWTPPGTLFAFVAAPGEPALTVIGVSDPTNPTYVASVATDKISKLTGKEGIIYGISLTDRSLSCIDASIAPSVLGHISGPGPPNYLDGAWEIAVRGNYCYISLQNDDGLTIVNISNPNNPIYAGGIYGA